MTDPAVIAAAITGGIAFTAVVGATVNTWLTLHHQRGADDQSRRHDRHMRLAESGLKAAVDFLAAADRTTRARQGLNTANISLQGAKSSGNQATYDQFRAMQQEAQEKSVIAIADAESAYSAVRLLVPSVADMARRYLEFCSKANAHPDETKVERERARQAVEETIRSALGGDLPDDWMFAESVPGRRRPRWRIRRARPPEAIENR